MKQINYEDLENERRNAYPIQGKKGVRPTKRPLMELFNDNKIKTIEILASGIKDYIHYSREEDRWWIKEKGVDREYIEFYFNGCKLQNNEYNLQNKSIKKSQGHKKPKLRTTPNQNEKNNNSQNYSEQIRRYLDEIITDLLLHFLKNSLSKISNDWWKKNVLNNLTDQQKNNAKRKNINSLDGLDFSALLRVFDLNWNELSQQHCLLYEDRNILKEMVAVRNRWAHKPKAGYILDDIYRDFDTMERFWKLLSGSQEVIDEFEAIRLGIWKEKILINH